MVQTKTISFPAQQGVAIPPFQKGFPMGAKLSSNGIVEFYMKMDDSTQGAPEPCTAYFLRPGKAYPNINNTGAKVAELQDGSGPVFLYLTCYAGG